MQFESVYTELVSPENDGLASATFAILNRIMQTSRQNGNRIQIDAVSPFRRQIKPRRFENAPLLAAVFKSTRFLQQSRSVSCKQKA